MSSISRFVLPRRARAWVRPPMDGGTVLTIYLVLQFAIPSDRGVGALGAAGSPASLFALVMLLWWIWDRVHRSLGATDQAVQPVRLAMFVFCLCVLISYVVAALSPLPQLDANGADRGLLRAGSLAGILLVANDGLVTRDRFLVLLRRIVVLGALYAGLGLAQFITRMNIVDAIQIPGLTGDGAGGLGTRVMFVRAQSTAVHTLEYASVLAIILPIAVTLAIYERQRSAVARWVPVATIALAAVLSVSRSGLVGVALGLLVLLPSWKPVVRRWAVAAGGVGLVGIYVAIPGMMGTIVGMFSNASGDSSVMSRTNSYEFVFQMWSLHPVMGRGFGTFLPTYRILDNQYLDDLIEIGVVGLMAILALLICAMVAALWRRPREDSLVHALAPALCASIVAGGVLSGFFDAFSFTQASGLLFMIAGLCGAYRNLVVRSGTQNQVGAPAHGVTGPLRLRNALVRMWYVAAAVLACAVPVMLYVRQVPGVYYTAYSISFLAPRSASGGNPLWTGAGGMTQYAGMIDRLTRAGVSTTDIETTSAPLYGTGIRSGQRAYLPNSGSQWNTLFAHPSIRVEIVAASPEAVVDSAHNITARIEEEAAKPQRRMGVKQSAYITTELSPSVPFVDYEPPRHSRALAGTLFLGLGFAAICSMGADRLLASARRRRLLRRDGVGD